MHHRFDDPAKWAPMFEDPARDAWQKPDEVIRALALSETAKVADIGSATGYFAVRLAKAEPGGKVYAVDVEPEMVKYLDERAKKEGLGNLVSVLGGADDSKLPEPVDLALVVDTYHHIENRTPYFGKLTATRVAIIDFRKGQPMGPPDQFKIDAAQVKDEMTTAGFVLEKEHAFLPNQHFLVFRRK
jgi:SAM-dependent methyltransferase